MTCYTLFLRLIALSSPLLFSFTKGDQGEAGPQGRQGTQGEPGPQGQQGARGGDGFPGAKVITISCLNQTTLS